MKNCFLILIFLASSVLVSSFIKPEKSTFRKRSFHLSNLYSAANNPYYIIIDKSDYELKVYDAEGWYATYPVVFGSKDQNDKYMEGDKRTPEGHFKILLKKIHPQWGPELLLDFPNEEI
jgi:murein L,D-transpeptidase YafK